MINIKHCNPLCQLLCPPMGVELTKPHLLIFCATLHVQHDRLQFGRIRAQDVLEEPSRSLQVPLFDLLGYKETFPK